MPEDQLLRQKMIDEQLKPRGVTDPATIESMLIVPRHLFVPKKYEAYGYEDGPLKIGFGQVISQPYLVGLMTQAAQLTSDSIVLEIGTGSGYGAAIASRIAKEVYTVERVPELSQKAQEVIESLGYGNIHFEISNGSIGLPEHAPYDAIISTAGAPEVPKAYEEQLKVGGRLVIPLGGLHDQKLYVIHRVSERKFKSTFLEYVRFVPLIGEQGWEL